MQELSLALDDQKLDMCLTHWGKRGGIGSKRGAWHSRMKLIVCVWMTVCTAVPPHWRLVELHLSAVLINCSNVVLITEHHNSWQVKLQHVLQLKIYICFPDLFFCAEALEWLKTVTSLHHYIHHVWRCSLNWWQLRNTINKLIWNGVEST